MTDLLPSYSSALVAWCDRIRPTLFPKWSDQQWSFLSQFIDHYDAPGAVLEIGCGDAMLANRFRAIGWSYTGIDRDAGMIQRAREAHTQHRQQRFLNVELLDHVGGPYDLVVSMGHSLGYGPVKQLKAEILHARKLTKVNGGRCLLDFRNLEWLRHHADRRARTYEAWHDSDIRMDERLSGKRWTVEIRSLSQRFPSETFVLTVPTAKLLRRAMDTNCDLYGDYNLTRYDQGRSPRLIVSAPANG